MHTDAGHPTTIGSGVSVGHRAVLHGCTIEDDCLDRDGLCRLNGARIGAGSLVAAGAVVPEGAVIPPGRSSPACPARSGARSTTRSRPHPGHAEVYLELARRHREATAP